MCWIKCYFYKLPNNKGESHIIIVNQICRESLVFKASVLNANEKPILGAYTPENQKHRGI